MSAIESGCSWVEANQQYLAAAVGVVRERVKQHVRRLGEDGNADGADQPLPVAEETLRALKEGMPAASALDTIGLAFGLSGFEREMLVLCAGVELDGAFAAHCAVAQGDQRSRFASFSLGLAALPGGHWSAVSPAAPLRRWRLIDVQPGDSLMTSPLRIDERVLHFLAGVEYADERVSALVEPVPSHIEATPFHRAIARHWSQREIGALPVVQLCGSDSVANRGTAAAAFAAAGLHTHAVRATSIPANAADRQVLARLWEREAALTRSGLLIEFDDVLTTDTTRVVFAFLDIVGGAIVLSAPEPLRGEHRALIRCDVDNPSAAEQSALWREALGPIAIGLNGELEGVLGQFNLSTRAIGAAADEVRMTESTGDGPLARRLWDACRAQTRPGLDGLAHRIAPVATWDDLVLPAPQLEALREIAGHVRQRFTVYEAWGFARKSARGLGISALFSGDSGTGKTMAAEVLANELRLDLYHIDLSSVVSKYIGETEKNLRRVFDAAEPGGALLLFDEADALFGKRSEVKDSHDRYANIEVSYLLQRIEAYRGLAILTTNLRNAIDPAFLRRVRFVVQFPFPDVALRAEIWRRVFPANAPTEGLDVNKLARLNVAGGNIRNIALHAAFLAADSGEPVRMAHLLRSARTECTKIEKPLSESETGGWV